MPDVELVNAIVQGLRRGEDAAAQQFIQTYALPLYRYLRSRCMSDADAEDILSMVFEKVVASIHTFDATRGTFTAWLYRVAQTCRADFYRAWAPLWADALPPDDVLAEGDGHELLQGPLERILEEGLDDSESELVLAVRDVLSRMQERYVDALLLAHTTDVTREEMARLFGVTRDNLRVLLNRAAARFRSLAQQHPVIAAWLARAEWLPGVEEGEPAARGGTALARA